MNWVDYTILGILAVFLLYGYSRGFIRQILGIAGILGGLYLAARYAPALAEAAAFAQVRSRNASLAIVVAFAGIFMAASLATGILLALIWKKLPKKELAGTDTFLGAVLGAVQGILILGGLSIAFLEWKDPAADPVKESVLAPRFAEGCRALVSLIPIDDQKKLRDEFEEGKKAVEESFPGGQPPAALRRKGSRSFADPGASEANPAGASGGDAPASSGAVSPLPVPLPPAPATGR